MSGIFGVASKCDCVTELFFGTDYHSHLGTRRAGMAVYDSEEGFTRVIHNITNSPFRTKFGDDVKDMKGTLGVGCISDFEAQPMLLTSHLGTYALVTVSKINNLDELVQLCYEKGHVHFHEMSNGAVNPTELVGALINLCDTIPDGIRYAQKMVDGSLTLLLLTKDGIYCARDRLGRTPIVIGKSENGYCASFESFAYLNLGFTDYKELGPNEVDFMTADGVQVIAKPQDEMRICTFLWVYYGYPTANYEGVNVEEMRYRCGAALAKRDNVKADMVAGVPDSGTAHAVGYANESGIPFARPFIKYTPTWPRSFMPTTQSQRNLIAHMKLIPVHNLIKGKSMILIDDSIVRGTQLRETTEFLYQSGASEVHIRPACPPLLFGCKYLNFSRSTSELDLIARRVIQRREGEATKEILEDYANPDSRNYKEMVEEIRKELNFTSLQFQRLDDMVESIGISSCKLCTYCWSGKE